MLFFIVYHKSQIEFISKNSGCTRAVTEYILMIFYVHQIIKETLT